MRDVLVRTLDGAWASVRTLKDVDIWVLHPYKRMSENGIVCWHVQHHIVNGQDLAKLFQGAWATQLEHAPAT